jgi:hypothetical protein
MDNFNFMKTDFNKLNRAFTIKIVAILVILVILVIFLSYVANYALYYKNMNRMISPILIPDVSDATKDYSELNTLFQNNIYDNVAHNNTNFSVSMWIYIKDWKYNYDFNKILFSKYFNEGGVTTGKRIYSPIIYLDKYNNKLIYKAHIYNKADGHPKLVKCEFNDIPIQSWVNIVFSVEDKTVNLYINGSLVKKCNFESIGYQGENYKLEILPKGKHYIDDDHSDNNNDGLNGFSGNISKLQYISKTINFAEIRKIYENGPYN